MHKFVLPVVGAILLTIIFGDIYYVGQQSLRMSANDPQIMIAEDTAAVLNQGGTPDSVFGSLKQYVDARGSLDPFVIVYDLNGNILSANGYVDKKVPAIPIGVLTDSKNKSYSFVTWEPTPGVRLAAVSVKANKYYVVSARSLRIVEDRELGRLQNTVEGWGLAITVLIGASIYMLRIKRPLL
jgi:hypothetical protein